MSFWTLRRAVLIGLVIQFGLAPLAGHSWDTYVFYHTAQTVATGQEQLYPHPQPSGWGYGYPPTWGLLLAGLWYAYAPLASALGAHPLTNAQLVSILGVNFGLGSAFIPDWLFLLLAKTPIILCELFTGLLLRKVVSERLGHPEWGTRAFALYFLNPFVVWMGSVWGMFDAIPTFFALLGTLLLLDRRELYSGFAFALAISLKYFPALFVIALIWGLRQPRGRPLGLFLLGLIGPLVAISIPFLLLDRFGYVQGVLSPTSGSTVGNLSIWTLVPLSGVSWIPDWVSALDILLIVVTIAALAAWIGRKRTSSNDPGLWIEMSVLALLVFYVLFRVVNNQYITWIMPYLALNVALRRERGVLLVVVSTLVLVYTLITVSYYSFFLPILTISPSLTWLVPRMYAIPPAARAIELVFWAVMALALVLRIERLRGGGPLSRWLDRLRFPSAIARFLRPTSAKQLPSGSPVPPRPVQAPVLQTP